MKYKVIDNFLNEEDFLKIKEITTASDFPWYFQDLINDAHSIEDKTCYFTHTVFNGKKQQSNFFDCFNNTFSNKLKVKAYIRIKLNCFPHTPKLRIHGHHRDYDFEHKGALYSINTCDGFTLLGNSIKIPSIENRMLLFEGHKLHASTTCTNQKARFNININYF
jgi:hypothetical protein